MSPTTAGRRIQMRTRFFIHAPHSVIGPVGQAEAVWQKPYLLQVEYSVEQDAAERGHGHH